MVWTIIKSDNKRINKGTRWDRIRKKYSGGPSLNTGAVKKFADMDFIGKTNMKILNGDIDATRILNPSLVMDLRHQMSQKSTKDSPQTAVKYKPNIDKCIVHNFEVEERLIHHELSKFRNQLQKKRMNCKIKSTILKKDDYRLNNKEIIMSLENTTRHIEDFYETPLLAIEQFDLFKSTLETRLDDDNTKLTNKNKKRDIDHRCVKFVDSVDILRATNTQNSLVIENFLFIDTSNELIERSENKVIESETNQKMSNENELNNNTEICEEISNITREALKEIQDESTLVEKEENFGVEGSSLRKYIAHPLVVTKIIPKQDTVVQSVPLESISSQEDEDSYTDEQNEVINQIFEMTSSSTNTQTLKNYFFKWMHFVTIQKIERENITNRNDRVHKINAFLDHIRKEKKKCQTTETVAKPVEQNSLKVYTMERKYKSKIKIQQDIIDLQRHKLERQERVISELKLKNLSEEVEEDRKDLKAELKSVIRNGDAAMRAKAKCLQIMGNLRDEEDEEFARLQGKALIQPKFLTNMQERALERSCRHEEAKQRRLKKEAEREAAKAAAEEAKRLADDEAKRLRIEELKEKRRQEKMAKVLKEHERQKAIENNKKAQQYCRYYLLRRVGMAVFKKALERKRSIQKQIELFRKRMIVKNAFAAWKNMYLLECERKLCMADDLYEKILKRFAYQTWNCYLRQQRSKYLVAVDWYELKLAQNIFTHWCGYTKLEKIIEDRKMKQAELHHEWHLKWKVLDRWQRLPQVLKLEKETDLRRQRWRMKIWELLPDYKPHRDDDIL